MLIPVCRIFRQNGPSANSGALFLACVLLCRSRWFVCSLFAKARLAHSASKEKDASTNHDLVGDGYNIGRLVWLLFIARSNTYQQSR